MAFVQFSRVSLAFGDRDILRAVNLNLAAGSRAALAGANGAGKSTLMRVIAGELQADSGDRAVQKGCRISYLPQSGVVHQGRTLREEAETAYSAVTALLDRMDELGGELEKTSGDGGRTAILLDEHHRLQEAVENSGYFRREASVSMVLGGLGFVPSDLDRQVEEFSGGWQMRIALAKVLLENPDILLLDEPTNYLDIEARSWLESWLQSYAGGCLLVSHDRYFLDVSVSEVYELFQGNLKRYAGNYSAYEKTRAAELESLLKRYEAQQEEIAKTEALIRRFRYKASKAAFAQELIKRLEKMERIEIPESFKRISITFPAPPHAGRTTLTLEGIGKSYSGRQVISGLDLSLDSGEKLVVVGRNGAGKTTLLRIIAGRDSAFEGSVKYGVGIAAGYFSQDDAALPNGSAINNLPLGKGPEGTAETPAGSRSVLEYLEAEAPTPLVPKVRDMLGAFLFRSDDVFKPLSVLSGGEKSRLALLKMLLKPMNLLILDEPTNHRDLQSKDILLDCLKNFTGTVIFVSHDRSFMEALSTKTLELKASCGIEAGNHRLFFGDYRYYLDRIAGETAENNEGGSLPPDSSRSAASVPPLSGAPPRNAPPPSAAPAAIPTGGDTPPGETQPKAILIKAGASGTGEYLSASERREKEKQRQTHIRRLERQEEELLKTLETLEAEKTALETELAKPAVYSKGEKAKVVKLRLDETAAAVEAKSREWEAKAAELEEIKKW
jgi:ATP-binding cassette subfamily F protein 3